MNKLKELFNSNPAIMGGTVTAIIMLMIYAIGFLFGSTYVILTAGFVIVVIIFGALSALIHNNR